MSIVILNSYNRTLHLETRKNSQSQFWTGESLTKFPPLFGKVHEKTDLTQADAMMFQNRT